MGKRKLTAAILLIFLIQGFVHAQRAEDKITPMQSVRTDVLRGLGQPSRRDDAGRFIYNYEDRTVTISFYEAGCGPNAEKELHMVRGTVIEVKTILAKPTKAIDYLSSIGTYETFPAHGGAKLFYNARAGMVVTSHLRHGEELIKSVYRIGTREKLHICLQETLGEDSALRELQLFGVHDFARPGTKFPPVDIGRFFDEDSEIAKQEVIDQFAKELLARENSVGLVIINGLRGEPADVVNKRTAVLLAILAKAGVECTRLVIENGLRGGLPGASFKVVHKSFLKEVNMEPRCM